LAQQETLTYERETNETMRFLLIPALLTACAVPGFAQTADRVYTADQTSNTVSVIDPATNTFLGSIHLGDDVPAALSPLYHGQLLVHGLGFSPDHKTLDVISIGSNSVTLIDTQTNLVKGTIYVGRSPHEGFFRPDGKELWVAVRGENYISVIDPVKMKEVRRIETANGPGMVLFRPDGKYSFVPSSFTPEMDVIDTATYKVIARVPQVSPFSPNLAVDQDEVWLR
jgi:YVTN family beta-propeller protein